MKQFKPQTPATDNTALALVIDPLPLIRAATIDLLDLVGVTAVSAHNFDTAVQRLHRHADQLSLILLTIDDFDSTGILIHAYLQNKFAHIPLIHVTPSSIERLRNMLGLQPNKSLLYLRTPYDVDALWALVHQALNENA